jgi:hypothetical protein
VVQVSTIIGFIGRNSFAVGSNNLVFGNNTRASRYATKPKWRYYDTKTAYDVGENAYITTLQVNQDAYFVSNVFIKSVNINDIYQSKTVDRGYVMVPDGVYSIFNR